MGTKIYREMWNRGFHDAAVAFYSRYQSGVYNTRDLDIIARAWRI